MLAGEKDAWRCLVEKYSRFVYTVALRLLGGVADREEAAAAVYARVFERLAARDFRLLRSFEGRCRFTTYLYRVVQTERGEALAGARAGWGSWEPNEEEQDPAAAPPMPVLRPEMLRDAVRQALGALVPRDRLLLQQRYRDGLKLHELARIHGYKDVNTAARALYAAVDGLRLLKTVREECRLGEEEVALLASALREELVELEATGSER